tara:strand:- start:356 stop:1132 length:777 start_codon:yes stop_codon:yes gene_type:complete
MLKEINITQSQNTTLNFSELSKQELDNYIQENLPSLSGIAKSKEKTIELIKFFELQKKQNQDLTSQLAKITKKVDGKKTKKEDQNVARIFLMLEEKMKNGDMKSFDSDGWTTDDKKIRVFRFLISENDQQFGFSGKQTCANALTDFRKDYSSIGSHFMSFGFVQTVKSFGEFAPFKSSEPTEDYLKNRFIVECTFYSSSEEYQRNAFHKKNGQRNAIDEKYSASQDVLELVKSNFEKSSMEILKLVLDFKNSKTIQAK